MSLFVYHLGLKFSKSKMAGFLEQDKNVGR